MNQPQTGEFCWNELAVADKEAAQSFYGQLLGWTFTDHDLGEFTYTMIKNRDQEFGGLWQIPNDRQKEIPPHWMGYILVDDLEKTLAKAEKLGAQVIMPITQAGEMGRFIILRDPAGANIAFWQSGTK
ncbi:VOC family protein [Legionella taurinensis]|uniref:VOC family protein n=1 Tax=Legionella taurinensis TaxID=70611 RepID=A0A3A5LK34_9GAMM|nr:VOC family protein [Legionella taurinensis]MDX1837924.1 VOC family protein [Legionella taurinensis]PUT39575.1 VOC family protein [Legionella taurinensis]PUT43270.1 VOC family protein [Legionella taurinensis]PUT45715.1 VOC family protein [Legionella taurinensis]PUT47628.1 VOC family protein [Legionella taurinensis]